MGETALLVVVVTLANTVAWMAMFNNIPDRVVEMAPWYRMVLLFLLVPPLAGVFAVAMVILCLLSMLVLGACDCGAAVVALFSGRERRTY